MKKRLLIGIIAVFCSMSVFSQSKKIWEKTRSLNTVAAYEEFILQYPAGKYTELARLNLSDLKEELVKNAEQEAKLKRFIETVKLNSQKLRAGMDFNDLDSLLNIRDIDTSGLIEGMMKPSLTSTSEIELQGVLYLKFENGHLKEWHLIQH